MNEHVKFTEQHRRRHAVVYVRYSTLHRVERNVESAARQYALRERQSSLVAEVVRASQTRHLKRWREPDMGCGSSEGTGHAACGMVWSW